MGLWGLGLHQLDAIENRTFPQIIASSLGRACRKLAQLRFGCNVPRGLRMNRWKPITSWILSLAFAFLLLRPMSGADAATVLSQASLYAMSQSSHLAEPLVATAPTSEAEDLALAQALDKYQHREKPDDYTKITDFLATYPTSGWKSALLTNLGIYYLHDGYFSQATEAWQTAWREGKAATDARARALVDRAVGELAHLYASMGRVEELASLFDEIGNRPITGSATEHIQYAREVLHLVGKDPRHLFICGPLALKSLMLSQGASVERVDFLQWYHAKGPQGTSLDEVAHLAEQAKFSYRIVFRKPGQPVPQSAIVHWKIGHFSAIVGTANGRFHVRDAVIAGGDLWVTPAALDQEASGYFLVPAATLIDKSWRPVDEQEARTVWGRGPTSEPLPGDEGDPPANGPLHGASSAGPPNPPIPNPPNPQTPKPPTPNTAGPNPPQICPFSNPGPSDNSGMCGYNIKESTVGLTLSDTPVGYAPPIGPNAMVTVTYNQREDSQPAVFNFFNVSQKWTINWLSYLTDDPTNPGANVSRYLSGGGASYYSGYNSTTNTFAAQISDGSILAITSQAPITYKRFLANGAIEVYSQSDGSTAYPRNIFLTQKIDPQGNSVTLSYDSHQRLVTLTDAVGRQTTFTYGLLSEPLLITKITDPFNRNATLTYDSSGRLSSITDVLGITSSFAYDANSLVDSMSTPYGTTTFAYTAPGTSGPPRFLQITDPLGYNEREEWLEPAPISDSDPSDTVPQGMPTIKNQFLEYRDSFHWDKNAYILAGCTPTGGCDYTMARDTHFSHAPGTEIKSTSVESVKYALENRVWYAEVGQADDAVFAGLYQQPTIVGRVLDDGTTQLSQSSYDASGYFNRTQTIDPVGRTRSYAYANQIDLSAISQTTAFGRQQTIAQFIYNTQHRPILYVDAAGQPMSFTYSPAGQIASITNALGQTTSFFYDSNSNLISTTNANSVTASTLTYDAFNRVATFTDSEGWTVSFTYDPADRVTKMTYPDGTSEAYTYKYLDLASYRDRLGRVWTYTYDANRRLTEVKNPSGAQVAYTYNGIGQLATFTDAKSNVTTWTYDVEGRVITKKYADTTALTYVYENTTSRLKSVTDALGQTKQYSYTLDNRVSGISYISPVNPTPNVSYSYDPYFARMDSMTDGNGTTQYTYVPLGSIGALRVQAEQSPLPSSSIQFSYDALGRVVSRTVAGAGADTMAYDAIGRMISRSNDLGTFTASYLGQTKLITQRALSGSSLATTWSYLPNIGDRRLSGISNVGLSTGQYSTFTYSTTPGPTISGIAEANDTSTTYPASTSQSATYNDLNQLVSVSGQTLTYDSDGNLLSDGQLNYSWDAENRLSSITYVSQPGKMTSFSYDGLGRRTAITSVPAGGGASVTMSYIWCGNKVCQARSGSNVDVREYYTEGEFLPGSPAQKYYYGTDQISSTRRVFATTTSAPAYDYDVYGNSTAAAPLVTDFGFSGLFYNADSGLYLTNYRAYNPAIGRWLSREPLGEMANPLGNLYGYADGNPLIYRDPSGENIGIIILLVVAVAITIETTVQDFYPPCLPPVTPPGNVCTPFNPTDTPELHSTSLSTEPPCAESPEFEHPEPIENLYPEPDFVGL